MADLEAKNLELQQTLEKTMQAGHSLEASKSRAEIAKSTLDETTTTNVWRRMQMLIKSSRT